jgi:hypothetical protein
MTNWPNIPVGYTGFYTQNSTIENQLLTSPKTAKIHTFGRLFGRPASLEIY